MPNQDHRHDPLLNLLDEYENLPFYKRWFFPIALKNQLYVYKANPSSESALGVYQAYHATWSIFKSAYSCLSSFDVLPHTRCFCSILSGSGFTSNLLRGKHRLANVDFIRESAPEHLSNLPTVIAIIRHDVKDLFEITREDIHFVVSSCYISNAINALLVFHHGGILRDHQSRQLLSAYKKSNMQQCAVTIVWLHQQNLFYRNGETNTSLVNYFIDSFSGLANDQDFSTLLSNYNSRNAVDSNSKSIYSCGEPCIEEKSEGPKNTLGTSIDSRRTNGLGFFDADAKGEQKQSSASELTPPSGH